VAVQRLSNSGRSGFSYKSLIAGITPLPSVPTIGAATALTYESVSVAFTAPGAYSGATYTATSSPSGLTGTSATSPIVVTGLSGDTAYTFTVTATNATGTSGASAASDTVTTPPAFVPTGSYDALATYTVGSGGVSNIQFAGIPSTYAHLQIRITARTTASTSFDALALQFNGDTASVYTLHTLLGNGSSAIGFASTPTTEAYLDKAAGASLTSGIFAGIICDVLDYSSISKFKTTRSLGGVDANGSGVIHLTSGLWRNTNSINSLKIYSVNSGNIAQHTNISIYGVK
jgi:trimeric autotransporter adhesin